MIYFLLQKTAKIAYYPVLNHCFIKINQKFNFIPVNLPGNTGYKVQKMKIKCKLKESLKTSGGNSQLINCIGNLIK